MKVKTTLSWLRYLLILLFPAIPHMLLSQEYISDNIKKAQESFSRLDAVNSFKDNLNQVDMNLLPSGISKTVGNMNVTIAVHSAELFPEYTALGVFLRLRIPDREEPLMFGAEDIKLSHEGDIIGDARLSLLSDIEIPIGNNNVLLRLKGGYNKDTGQASEQTYAAIDCQGLKQLGIAAEIELSDNLCSPVDADGNIIPNRKVTGEFQIQAADWSDIVARVSLPSFEIKGLTGFVWNIRDAVFDFSDQRNDATLVFPSEYRQYLIPGNEVLWKGIYVKDLSVTLPPQFAKEKKERVSFFAQNMLIDDNGITGIFGAENILSFNEGNASGWSFSVDLFSLRLTANRLEEASFKGVLGLPVSDNTKLMYDGQIAAGDKYLMRVSKMDTLAFDIFQARAELDPNSYIEFKVVDKQFRPEAMLHGRMTINVTSSEADTSANASSSSEKGKSLTAIQGIEFRSLHLKTEAPFITAQYFGYKGEAKLMNFPISIHEISLRSSGYEAALGIDMDVSLGTFKASGKIEIAGEMQEGKLSRWKYKKTDIGYIQLSATIAELMKLEGGLAIMRDDPVYGDGFSGNLSVNFTKDKGPLKGLEVRMRGMFGKTDYHYWFVDGIASLGVGIPVGPGINLTGFGGGVSYRMKPQGIDARQGKGNILTATGMTYVPDESYSLGVKASTTFNLGKNEVAQGEACFELAFNNKGGLNYAGFYGYAQFLASIPGLDKIEEVIGDKYKDIIKMEEKMAAKLPGDVTKTLEKTKQYNPGEAGKLYTDEDKLGKASFTAAVGIQFNFAESSFHANFDLYVNAVGGIIRGSGSNNRAGWAVIHIDPKDWYLHMGTPTDRIGLKFGIGKILNIETGSYLMVGTQIPAAPGPPEQVARILKEDTSNLDYMKNLNMITGGKGFAFGASMHISTGDLTFLILYANFAAGTGFDIMLKDYGDAQCKGRSGAIGMDGWYANGQAYAYLHGELGVKISLWFLKAKIPIITADFAALMQAKLPNPSSFKAYIAVQANVLGLVKVNCRFKMLVGEDCELVIPGGSPLDMAMINDLSPTDRSSDVSVFTAPQATFNMAMEKAFRVQDDEGEKTFRIKVRDFTLNDGQKNIQGVIRWNTEKDVASFYSHEILPPYKEVTALVNVVFEEYRNNRWTPVYTAGKEAVESKSIRFNTADAPDDIPFHNVEYAYPVVSQQHYLKGESSKGYIQLKFGQEYLFPDGYGYKIRLRDDSEGEMLTGLRYNSSLKKVEFDMPVTQNSTGYRISLESLAKEGAEAMTATRSQSLLNDADDGEISIEGKQASAATRTDLGKELLAYDFSTSRYNTFSEKIGNIEKGSAAVNKISSDVLMFEYETIGMEPFDIVELTGTDYTAGVPLIEASAALDDYFYREKIYPLLYRDYPVDGTFRLTSREEALYGVPPAKALPLMSKYLNELESGSKAGLITRRFPYYYNLPAVYKSDFLDIQKQVINTYLFNASNMTLQKYLNATFPFISAGGYRIGLQYRMPDGSKGTASQFEYTNFID